VGAIVRATTLSGKVSGATCSHCVPVSRDPLADYSGISTSWITEKREALQLLLMADGVPANRVAWTLRIHERTAEKWRHRFRKGDPVAMLADAPRAGRPRALSRTPTAP
jgi:hypothetical protein